MKKPNWKHVEARDLRRVCYHEAGHYEMAEHFGLEPSCTIIREGDPNDTESAWTGQTHYLNAQVTPYQRAVISWAGALVEELFEYPVAEWQEMIDEAADNVLCAYEMGDASPSPSDRAMIAGCKQFRRAFKRACKLVVLRRQGIRDFAEQMIARYTTENKISGSVRRHAKGAAGANYPAAPPPQAGVRQHEQTQPKADTRRRRGL